MATQRRILGAALAQSPQQTEDAIEVAGPAVAALPTGIPEHDALSSMLSELAGSASAKVTVYRVSKNGPMAYVFACAPDAFSLDDLRDNYGGGDFRLFISKNGQLYRNILVSVERSSDPAAPAVAVSRSNHEPSAVETLAAAMRDGFARQAEALREVAAMRAAPPASPFAGLDLPAVITALATLLPALRPLPAPIPRDGGEGSINMLLKGIELARELRENGGGEEPSMMGVLKDLIRSPMMAQAVAATMQPQVQRNPTVRPGAPPGGGGAAPAPALAAPQQSFARETSSQPATDDPAMLQQAMLKHYLGILCAKAATDADPVLYADVVLDNMPDEMLEKLMAEQPTPVDALIRLHPDVAQYRDWFALLVGTVAEAYNAPPEGEEGTDDASQHAAPVSTGQPAIG